MSDDLKKLIAEACERFDALPKAEQLERQFEQRVSFAYGNLACTTNHKPQSRETVWIQAAKQELRRLWKTEAGDE